MVSWPNIKEEDLIPMLLENRPIIDLLSYSHKQLHWLFPNNSGFVLGVPLCVEPGALTPEEFHNRKQAIAEYHVHTFDITSDYDRLVYCIVKQRITTKWYIENVCKISDDATSVYLEWIQPYYMLVAPRVLKPIDNNGI